MIFLHVSAVFAVDYGCEKAIELHLPWLEACIRSKAKEVQVIKGNQGRKHWLEF